MKARRYLRCLIFAIIGMYGPPQNCKRKLRNDGLVCANVFGL